MGLGQRNVVVIGAGSAGLAVSHALHERGVDHQILERGRIGETWRSERWDSFTMVTPTWATALPGLPHDGHDPDGFLTRAEWLDYLDRYVTQIPPPVREGVTVRALQPGIRNRFRIVIEDGEIAARVAIIATGLFRSPVIPLFASNLPASIRQLPSARYRNPPSLAPGAILVVGTGQSGSQIAEELRAAGREVFLSVGRIGRTPRRYRGRDSMWWRQQPDFLVGARSRPASYSHMTGKDGGRDLNLHQFARDGIQLLGRIEGVTDGRLILAPDLHQRLAEADAADLAFRRAVDRFVEWHGLDAAPDPLPNGEDLRDGLAQPILATLDLRHAGITTVIWATGFRPDPSWVEFPVFDDAGYPLRTDGLTAVPGLSIAGMRWQLPGTTTLIGGLGPEAERIAAHVAEDLASVHSVASASATAVSSGA